MLGVSNPLLCLGFSIRILQVQEGTRLDHPIEPRVHEDIDPLETDPNLVNPTRTIRLAFHLHPITAREEVANSTRLAPSKCSKVRLLSVTNGNIEQAVAEGRFRQDLYYRLATVPIVVPPRRERRWDIPEIAVGCLNRTDVNNDWELDGEAIELLTSLHLPWSGNIRELESVLERARNRARTDGSQSSVIEARLRSRSIRR